jgi:hypothetical protein
MTNGNQIDENILYNLRLKNVHVTLETFPKAKNGQPYLRMKSGERVFFNVFLRKYGLNGSSTKYQKKDVIRRMKLVPYFKRFFLSNKVEIHEDRPDRWIVK